MKKRAKRRIAGKKKTARRTARNKRKGIVAACLLAAAMFIIGINLIVIKTASPLIIPADDVRGSIGEEGADCILVLGASVSYDGPSPILADRLDKGLELYSLGVSQIMLLSGDNGTIEYNEVQAMKDYALANGADIGIGAENIYLDYAGFSTYDSAFRCKEIFQAERVVIVTQRYHLYRAVWNAKKAGLDVVGVAAKDTEYGQALRDLREIPARVKDFFLTLVGHKPRIMGDPVPLDYPSTQG